MDGEWVGRDLMRGLCHPVGRNHRSPKRDGSRCGEFFVKRCTAAAYETKPYRRGARVIFGGTVKKDSMNGGYCRVPRHAETDYIGPKQVSGEYACARKGGASSACQGRQKPCDEPRVI